MSALDDLIDGEIESQDRWNDKKMLYEAKKELAALRNPWQPISTAPKDGTHISVYSDIDGDGLLIEFWDVENGEWFYGSVYETDVEWTHWKPFETPEGES